MFIEIFKKVLKDYEKYVNFLHKLKNTYHLTPLLKIIKLKEINNNITFFIYKGIEVSHKSRTSSLKITKCSHSSHKSELFKYKK